jgi:S-adenosylmethionine:tRNA-ribosyltransferase-isomerase (queuine synthetase)
MRAYKEKDKSLARMIRDRDDYEKMTPHKLFAKIQQHEFEDAPTKTRESHALVANEQESSKKSLMGKDHKSKKIVESLVMMKAQAKKTCQCLSRLSRNL